MLSLDVEASAATAASNLKEIAITERVACPGVVYDVI